MTIAHVPVVVLGGGPTGVSVATLLAQQGIRCLILDRWSQVYPQPRAVHLDDEVFRVIARLGIADEFAAISRPALGLRLLDSSMRVLAEFSRGTTLSRNGFPQANMFDQPELERLLRTNLKRYPHAELRGNVDVTDIAEGTIDRTRVTYSDRGDGTAHVVEADYVLGCDGANSIARSRIGAHMENLGFEQRWLVVDVAAAAHLDQWEGVHQVCDPHRAATYMRIGEERYRWEFRLLDHETAADFDTLDTLAPLIRPWIPQVSNGQLEVVRVTEYTFRAQLADHWRRGNVFILGDAAHLTPPFIGQGMGAGLRDAMNLAWKLAGVLNFTLPAAVLDTYEQERKPHARSMIRLALGVGRAMTAGGNLGTVMRRIVVPMLPRLPGLRAKVINGESPALRTSALVHKHRALVHKHRAQVHKHRAQGRLAGTLCPNPVVADGHRLDSVLGNDFAIITTSAPRREDRALIKHRGAVLHVAEPGTELARWLHRGHADAATIRPDRTVMQAGRDVRALCATIPVVTKV